MDDIQSIINRLANRNTEDIARHTDGMGLDYDYGLAAKAIVEGKAKGLADNGHSTDVGKLPWHPTFSQESGYSNSKTPGGVWDKYGNYRPSVQMATDGRVRGLSEYFREVEPNGKLLTPILMREDVFKELSR